MPHHPSLPGLHPDTIDRDTPVAAADASRRLPDWPTGYDRGRCRSCNALVFWATSCTGLGEPKRRPDGSVIKMAMDPFPVPEGNLMLMFPAKVAPIGAVFVEAHERWRTHFASCPDANAHRKPRS